ncbi:hypothetical protein [Yinghuangia soli]|uniref:Uncharacterized protein n=1 Tax=Yinghuangia soli TaxID=2908204 RepID=A0AA41Q844_9ACTN|nr:hypothetical protein [Yinghuangia soli]MCF2532640.1 hypothetical protein [Yinghuangia soli]
MPQPLLLRTSWRPMLDRWANRKSYMATVETSSITLEFDIPKTDRMLITRFTTTKSLLVVFMTNGRTLKPDQLAVAAAAANAWNTEQLVPMLSVWDVRGPHPCIAGVCVLPLSCRLTQPDFDVLADEWVEHGRAMFARCRELFRI